MTDSYAPPSLSWIAWLADSPMFINGQQIGTCPCSATRSL
jgi:hypothetical protein